MMLYSNLLTDGAGVVVEGVGGGGGYVPPPYIPPPPPPVPLPPPPGGLPVLQPYPPAPKPCSTCAQVPKPVAPPPSQVITVQVPGAPGQAGAPGAGPGATFAQMVTPENMGLLLLVIALGLAAAAAYNEQRKGR